MLEGSSSGLALDRRFPSVLLAIWLTRVKSRREKAVSGPADAGCTARLGSDVRVVRAALHTGAAMVGLWLLECWWLCPEPRGEVRGELRRPHRRANEHGRVHGTVGTRSTCGPAGTAAWWAWCGWRACTRSA